MSNQNYDEVVTLAQDLIRIPSHTGGEEKIAAFIKDYLAKYGFEVIINEYNTVTAILKKGAGPTVMVDAHIDTVNVNPEEWKHHPYSGDIENGRVYGRGASDMKGALAAMMNAGKILSGDKSIKGTFIISGASWEEFFEGYTLGKSIEALEKKNLKPDYVIIGEASELNVKRGQRGRTRIHFDIKGKPSHSAHPDKGINAVYKAADLIKKIQQIPLPEDDFLGKGIIELIGIESFPQPFDSVVPSLCRVSYDLRLLPGQTKEDIINMISKVVDELKSDDPDFSCDFIIDSKDLETKDGRKENVQAFPPAWKLDENHPFVRKAVKALESIGQKPEITKYGFCTNGSYSAGEAGIPTIGFGPGYENGAHIIDENIEIDHLVKARDGYVAIIKSILQ